MNETLSHSLWVGMALMLVIEGILPFLNPAAFKRTLLQMTKMRDSQLRITGLLSMLLGLILLYWIN